MESEEERPEHILFMENQYVKVFGIIKSLQGEKIVQAFRILPIKELNEVTHHMLECMSASIHYSQAGSGDEINHDMQMGYNENPLKNANNNSTATSGNSAGLSSCHTQVKISCASILRLLSDQNLCVVNNV